MVSGANGLRSLGEGALPRGFPEGSGAVSRAAPKTQPSLDQLDFLEALARTRNVAAAALSAGISRESAYRLRGRDPHGLFAAAWDHNKLPPPDEAPAGKGAPPADATGRGPAVAAKFVEVVKDVGVPRATVSIRYTRPDPSDLPPPQ